jgi:Ca2+-binding RTX toxin-like protein
MSQNIGIAYGAIIENAIGGGGNDRINGNQANNSFTGNGGADTFVIADYSGTVQRPTGAIQVVDNSVDTIKDFSHAQGDKIDLVSFGHGTVTNVAYRPGTSRLVMTESETGTILEADLPAQGAPLFGA